MKKQTNQHSIKLLSLAICAALTIIIGVTFSASAQQLKPVLKDRLVKVLQEKSLSSEQITSIIKKNGVDFQLTRAVETELRNAGSDNTVIEAVRNNYRGEALLTGENASTATKNPSPKVVGQRSTIVSPKGAPTQDDVEKAITDTFKENYKEPWMTSTDVITVEFSELKIAARTKRMGIQNSSKYDTGTFVYPVRVKVKVSVDRGRNGIDVKERGVSKYDSFFFYKDDFGTWTFKTGAL